jgi:myosin heavy subunit
VVAEYSHSLSFFFSMYKIPDFLKKNRDALHGDLVMELKDSESVFVSAIFGGGKNNGGNGGPRTKKIRRNTKLPDSIAFKFKNQLKALNNELLKTEPHYIRCIKTNSVKSVHYFEPDICLRQLIFAGVRQTFIPPFLLV